MSPRPPMPWKVGGHDSPQLLRQRRPCPVQVCTRRFYLLGVSGLPCQAMSVCITEASSLSCNEYYMRHNPLILHCALTSVQARMTRTVSQCFLRRVTRKIKHGACVLPGVIKPLQLLLALHFVKSSHHTPDRDVML